MLSGEGNENDEKTTIGLISKKTTLHVQHTFCPFLCSCLARPQRETSRNFQVTRFMEEMSYLLLFTFCHSLISPWWPLGFLIFSPPLKNVHVVLPTNSSLSSALAFSVAIFLVELCWPVAHFIFSLYSKFVNVTINLSFFLYKETISAFRFRLY